MKMQFANLLFILAVCCCGFIPGALGLDCWECWAEDTENPCWYGYNLHENLDYQMSIANCLEVEEKVESKVPVCVMAQLFNGTKEIFRGRTCSNAEAEEIGQCQTATNLLGLRAKTCTCKTDLCNTASTSNTLLSKVLFLPALLLLRLVYCR